MPTPMVFFHSPIPYLTNKTTGVNLTHTEIDLSFPVLLTTQPGWDPKFPQDCKGEKAVAGQETKHSLRLPWSVTLPPHTEFHLTLKLKQITYQSQELAVQAHAANLL